MTTPPYSFQDRGGGSRAGCTVNFTWKLKGRASDCAERKVLKEVRATHRSHWGPKDPQLGARGLRAQGAMIVPPHSSQGNRAKELVILGKMTPVYFWSYVSR